jgi:hypothetical protein
MDERAVRPSRAGRRWWALPALALAGLAGCSSSSTAAANHVVVIGDSAAVLEQSTLAPLLNPRYQVTYLIRYYGRIGPIVATASGHLSDGGTPGVVVVNLGTDDASRPRPGSDSAAPLQPLIDVVAHVPCVVLTTVSLGADERSRHSVALIVNDQIKRLAKADPTRFKVVDWENFLVTLPPASLSTYLQADRIHPTPAGARWLAQSDLSGIEACGTSAQPTVIGPLGR